MMLMMVSMAFGQGPVAYYPSDGKISDISAQEIEKEENIVYSSGWITNRTDLFQSDGIGVYPVVADEDGVDAINPGYRTRGVTAGSDLDNDGLKEVLITDYRTRGVHVYESTGDNTLEWVASVGDEFTTYYTTPRHVITGDLDHNGRGEIIFLSMQDTADAFTGIHIWEWDGVDGSDAYVRYVIPILVDGAEVDRYYGERALNIGDVDGDGQVEILISINGLDPSFDAILIASIQGSFSTGNANMVVEYSNARTSANDFAGSPWGQPNIGDLDGDGRLEAHFFVWDNAKMLLVESTGIDTYELQSVTVLDTSYSDQTVFGTTYITDIDNDGHDELFGGMYPSGWFWQVSGGDDVSIMGYETGKIEILSQTGVFWDVTGGDVDGDGFDELFTVEYNQARVHQWHYNGNFWEETLLVEWPDLMGGLALDFAGDLDGDGYPELIQGFIEKPFSEGNPNGYSFAVIEYGIDIPLENSLVAHYPFNGNANDESWNRSDGVVNGPVLVEDRFGNPNSAYEFDGNDDYIWLGDSNIFRPSNITVIAWFNSTSQNLGSPLNQYIIKNRLYGYNIGLNPFVDSTMPHIGGFSCAIWHNENEYYKYVSTDKTYNDGKWHFIAMSYEGSIFTVYVDGEVVDQDPNRDPSEIYYQSGGTAIGRDGDIAAGHFEGKIDDIYIYNYSLPIEEIDSLYYLNDWDPNPLVAYYPFNGNANDESGNGHDGINNGAVLTTDRFGNANSAYSFDGLDDDINTSFTPVISPTDDFSLSAWIKTVSNSSHFLGFEQTGAQQIAVFIDDGPARFIFRDDEANNPSLFSASDVNDGKWHHIVYSRSGQKDSLYCYVDGQFETSTSDLHTTAFLNATNPISMSLGAGNHGTLGPINNYSGILDDVRFFNKLLTGKEISELYREGGWDPSLVAHYPFNGNANDESGNGNDGTNNGATLTTDRFGNAESAFSFDGVGNNIEISETINLDGFQAFTASLWINPAMEMNSNTGRQDIVYKGLSGSYTLNYDSQDGALVATVNGAQTSISFLSDFHANQWFHTILVYDGSSILKMYIDGDLVGVPDGLGPGTNLDTNEPLFLGSTAEPQYFFNGKLDDFRIYNRALTGDEIKILYHEDDWPCSAPRPQLTTGDIDGTRLVIPPGQQTIDASFTLHNMGNAEADYVLEIASSDSTWLLYMDEPDTEITFDGNIWKMRPDGSEKTQLTFDVKDRDAVWSPDGSKITFYSYRDGQADVWIMNSDGTALTNLTNQPEIFDAWPSWSPDGEWIFFGSTRDHDQAEIYKINIHTLEVVRLTFNEDLDGRPKVSPDGCHFVSFYRIPGQPADIRVYSLMDGSFSQFGNPMSSDYQASWMPKGNRVIWSSWMDEGSLEIVSARIDGSDFRVETHTGLNKYYPRSSPDGQYIAFPASVNNEYGGDEIFVYHRAFHSLSLITGNTIPNSEWGPDWLQVMGIPGWVTTDVSSGQLAVGSESQVNISIDVSALALGDHTASVIARDAENGRILAIYPINIRITDELRPHIFAVEDVPDDQGNWVEVHWAASALDGAGEITQYGVLERNPFTDQWVSLGSTPALQRFGYTFLAHTYMNAMLENPFESEFRIIAHTMDPEKYFGSESAWGSSWDNLFPGPPMGLTAYEENDKVVLSWDHAEDEDFQYFRLYRSTVEDFATEELILETEEIGYLDSGVEVGITYYYRISAVDFNQNEGESSEAINHFVVGIDSNNLPDEFTLERNYPNPFNPTTTIRYGLPETSDVTLVVYDITGREVATLINHSQAAGWYAMQWNGTSQAGTPVGTGVYLARIQAGNYSSVIKMVYLR
jgi:Tol biopolymer transport system component